MEQEEKAMELSALSPAKGSKKNRKRLGRGPGTGLGKTAGRGHKGQRSRSGFSRRPGFEGGQMPLVRRVPKRGFTSMSKVAWSVINVSQLQDLDLDEVTPEVLVERGLARADRKVKILGDGDLERSVTVTAHGFSKSAREKIEKAGGTVSTVDG